MALILDGTLGITSPGGDTSTSLTTGSLTVSGLTATSLTNSGNLTFTGTGNRITGDFGNANIANRLLFQNSATNGYSTLGIIPNGTGTVSAWNTYNNSDPTNSSIGNLRISSTDVRVESTITGTGTYLPITLFTGGSERMRVDTSGNVGIGTTSTASNKLNVNGSQVLLANGQIKFADAANNLVSSIQNSGANGVSQIEFTTSSTERARITSTGYVGIATTAPTAQLEIGTSVTANPAIRVGDFQNTGPNGGIPSIESLGSRNDGNVTFGGRFGAAFRRTDGTAIASGQVLGYYAFGGQWGTDTSFQSSKYLYTASILGIASSSFTSATTMSTDIAFFTGNTGNTLQAPNVGYGTERMRLDSFGNLGLGCTPSAWSSGLGAMQFKNGGASVWANGITAGYIYSNAYYDGTTNRYINTGFANSYAINNNSGIFAWFTAPSGTAGNAITFTQAMTLDNSGNLMVGTTTAGATLTVAGAASFQAPKTVNASTYTMLAADSSLIITTTNCTITLLSAASNAGRILYVKNVTANSLTSASSNVVPLGSTTAGTAILAATAGKFAMLQSDGTNWVTMMAN